MLLLKSVLLKNLKHQTLIILSGDILTPQYFKHPTNNSHFFLSLSSYHIILSILPIFFSLTRCLLAFGCQNIFFFTFILDLSLFFYLFLLLGVDWHMSVHESFY